MIDPQRGGEPDGPLYEMFSDEPPEPDGPGATPSGRRRALWISAAALAAVAVAVPLIILLTRSEPEQLATPDRLAGLSLDRNADATSTANYLQNALTAGMDLKNAVAAVYTDGRGDSHSVIFVGGTTSEGNQDARLIRIFGLFDDATDGITGLTSEAAGPHGGAVRCGLATENDSGASPGDDTEMAVCGWADDDTVGIAIFPNRPIDEAAALLQKMRTGIQGKA
jgi:hypothetical protein